MLMQLSHQKLVPLVEDTTPIYLLDNNAGLSYRTHGTTRNGTPYMCQTNPDLIANVIAERKRRQLVSMCNFRKG